MTLLLLQRVARHRIDVKQIEQYNETIRVMSELGYTLDEINETDIQKRYETSLKYKIKKRIKRIIG